MLPYWAGIGLFIAGVLVGWFIRVLQDEEER